MGGFCLWLRLIVDLIAWWAPELTLVEPVVLALELHQLGVYRSGRARGGEEVVMGLGGRCMPLRSRAQVREGGGWRCGCVSTVVSICISVVVIIGYDVVAAWGPIRHGVICVFIMDSTLEHWSGMGGV